MGTLEQCEHMSYLQITTDPEEAMILTPMQWDLLRALAEEKDYKVIESVLAKARSLKAVMKRLERKGMVMWRYDHKMRRGRWVVTKAGRSALKRE